MTRDEKNRKLAEWIEPIPRKGNFAVGASREEEGLVRSTGKAWWLETSGDWLQGIKGQWEPVDFYADETANALLLEKMVESGLNPCVVFETTKEWACDANGGDGQATYAKDRKTAICEAALKLLEVTE